MAAAHLGPTACCSSLQLASLGHSLVSFQTEAELQGLDAGEVERLAAEAAELQARATTALRLAQERLQAHMQAGDGGAPASSGSVALATPLEPPAAGVAAASAAAGDAELVAPAGAAGAGADMPPAAPVAVGAPSQPPEAQRLLQLCILLLAAGEALLLWGAHAVQAASGGRLQLPRTLALAPLLPARTALAALLLAADVWVVLLALLRGQRWAAAAL